MKYVISDVHGCSKTLEALLAKLDNIDPEDIIFVGDLIDRGPNSRSVVEIVRNSGYQCVYGNHEDMACKSLSNLQDYGTISTIWMENGGIETLKSYILDDKEFDINELESCIDIEQLIDDIKWMKYLPRYIVCDEEYNDKQLFVSHAVSSDYIGSIDDNEHPIVQNLMIWNREYPDYDNDFYFNISGHNLIFKFKDKHNVKEEYLKSGVLIDLEKEFAIIDTGAFINYTYKIDSEFVGKLSCVSFPNLDVIQEDNCD